ncbi:hypothetical protein [Nitrosopumilus ureiphilus]|uniref:Uncharacterized protein n=1 Tax=Nitrosopumilus ureiphilus TaxID=1470067 RepID=A0A7D5RGQ9_9ARCH|nr:hypothetical protein [Nitrosopumilus ureiphilus]QLH07105.1 hypothetical protein C5F50_08495 [Nitrosopumilus ureiphilus]
MSRTDLVSATLQIMKAIQNGEAYTLNKISKKTELNFRTVQKALNLIEACQKQLESKKINITHLGHATHIQMKSKSGITSMPMHIQKMLIRTSYYPTPDRNEEILVYLLQNGATKNTSAIQMNSSPILDELVTAEHVIKKGKKYYLSDMGAITAKGAMSLYPELI